MLVLTVHNCFKKVEFPKGVSQVADEKLLVTMLQGSLNLQSIIWDNEA